MQNTCKFMEFVPLNTPGTLCILTFQRGVTGTARMLDALTHLSISRQVREQM